MAQNPFPLSVQRTLEQVSATMPKFMEGYMDLTNRNRTIRQILDRYGMIEYNADMSYAASWNIADVLPEVTDLNDEPPTFEGNPALDRLSMIPRYKQSNTKLGYIEWLENQRTDKQLVNLMQKRQEDCAKAMDNYFNQGFYDDGATGTNLHGLESFFGAGTCTATDRVAAPSDSYGGQSTVLGARGGTWSSVASGGITYNASIATGWPVGAGDPRYDALAPLLMNITSTSWASGDNSGWRSNCEEIMRLTQQLQIDRTGKTRGEGMRVHLLSLQLYNDLTEALAVRNQVYEPLSEGVEYGIPNVFNFEGCGFAQDTDCPAGTGYFLDTSMIEFKTPFSKLVSPLLGDEDPMQFLIQFMAYVGMWKLGGNFRHQPKFHAKYAPYA